MTNREAFQRGAAITNAIRKEKRRLSRKMVKSKLRKMDCPRSVKGCLRFLGLNPYDGSRQFWNGIEIQKFWMLVDAHILWKQAMKQCNGDTERAYSLNAAWDRVEKIFADHGYAL